MERYFGGKSDIADGAQYGVAMYWAMMTMTTVGYGDIAAETEAEYWFVTIAMLVGGFVFGMIVGFLGEMSKNANPAESFRQQKVGLINAFVLLCSPSPAVVNTVRMLGRTRGGHAPRAGSLDLKDSCGALQMPGPAGILYSGARPRCATSWCTTTRRRRRWTRWRS